MATYTTNFSSWSDFENLLIATQAYESSPAFTSVENTATNLTTLLFSITPSVNSSTSATGYSGGATAYYYGTNFGTASAVITSANITDGTNTLSVTGSVNAGGGTITSISFNGQGYSEYGVGQIPLDGSPHVYTSWSSTDPTALGAVSFSSTGTQTFYSATTATISFSTTVISDAFGHSTSVSGLNYSISGDPTTFDYIYVLHGMLAGDDVANGSSGSDELRTFAGNDTLDGKAEADVMVGGIGNDTYVVDVAGDVITEVSGEGTDQVNVAFAVAGTYTLSANLENATVTSGATIITNITGNADNNTLTGNAAANTLDGGAGADTLAGGSGDDVLIGGADTDTASFSGNRSQYTLTATVTGWTLNGVDGTDTLTSIEFAQFVDQTISLGNYAPTGSVTITGTATQNQTLTASNTLADINGLGTIGYQWQADGANISGATNSNYVLTQAEVGKAISVAASYTDLHGTAESVASSATTAVANVNDLPAGSLTISGTATQSQILTVVNTLTDADGMGIISYQWQADGANISGAINSNYVLTQAEVGKAISVAASYTDLHGTAESVASSTTTVVVNVNDAPAGSVTISGTAAKGQALTASNALADIDGLGIISYQWQADGIAINGATNNTYLLTQAEVGKAISVVASYTDLYGTAEAVTSSSTANVYVPSTSRYTLLGTGANLMDFYIPYGNLTLDGQNIVFKGNSGIDSVYVGSANGLLFDFTQAGLGVDQIYLSGNWADYTRSYSGSVVTLIRTNGGGEIIKTISGDSLIFADGTVSVLSALNFLKGTAAEPVPTGATSTAFPMTASTTLNNTVRAVVQDASGETIALSRPGVAMIAKGGSGVDVVYVTAGANLDGTQLGLAQDKLYLTGNWADYNGTYAGSVVTLTRPVGTDTETVKFLGGSTSAYDSIVFADGTANSIDVLNYVKATAATPTLNTTEVTPLGTGDIVTGTTAAESLNGTATGDVIYGGGGADIINGGAGNDTIVISDTGTTTASSATIQITSTANGTDTLIGFSATPVTNGGDMLDFTAIANLTDAVATGQTLMTDFTANNVFIFDSTPITITEAANAIATDVSVLATNGYIVLADSANHNAVTVYHSADLAGNGAETALTILSGVNITQLTTGNFLV